MIVGDFAATWLAHLKLTDIHPRTWASYERLYRLHLQEVLAHFDFEALKKRRVRAALIRLNQNGRQRRTVQNCYTAFSSLCEYAVAEGHLSENPCSGCLKGIFRRRPAGWGTARSMTREQLATFLTALPEAAPDLADYFVTLAGTGMRPSEVLGLEPGHLDPARRTIHVRQQWIAGKVDLPKGGKLRFVVDVPHEVMNRLVARADGNPDWLFCSRRTGQPFNYTWIVRTMKKVVAWAELPTDRHFTPHSLRHTWATIAIEECTDLAWVSRQLGHASIATTVDLYGAAAMPKHPEVADRLDALLNRRGPLRAAVQPAVRLPSVPLVPLPGARAAQRG